MADRAAPSVKVGSTTYLCIQSMSLTVNGADISYYCGANVLHAAGPQDVMFTFSLALDKDDTAEVAALAYNTEAAMTAYPAGATTTYIQHATTNATIVDVAHVSDPGSVILLNVTARWDNLTSGAVPS